MEPPSSKSLVLQKLSRLKMKPKVKIPARLISQPVEPLLESTDTASKMSSSKSDQDNSSNELPSTDTQNQTNFQDGVKDILSGSPEKNLEELKANDLSSVDGDNHVNEQHTKSSRSTVERIKQKQEEINTSSVIEEPKDQCHGLPLPRYKPRSANKTKIRPNIEGVSHRIRTYSSASESEDEGKRLQSRARHSAVKKPSLGVQPQPADPLEIKKVDEVKAKKKVEEKTQLEMRKEDMRRKFSKGHVETSKMTMFDLIYYNPDGEKPTRSKEKIVTRRRIAESDAPKQTIDPDSNYILEERIAEEEEERRLMEENTISEEVNKEEGTDKHGEGDDEEDSAMPVPQVRIGPNGEIILDEQSLVIETNETKKRKSELANGAVIVENSAGLVNYGSWRKRKRSSKWSIRETARFYRALSMLGTDFSLMESIFPRRTRFELKRKFKLEEKINRALIDKTIGTQKPFDATVFGDESDDESETESTAAKSQSKRKQKGSNNHESADPLETSGDQPQKKKKRKRLVIVESEDEVNETEGAIASRPENVVQEPAMSPNNVNAEAGEEAVMESADGNGDCSTPPAVSPKNSALPGSLVLITSASSNDEADQLVQVYRISSPTLPLN